MENFEFVFVGYGHYKVTYTSPKTGKRYSVTTYNMPLIDVTKNSNNPLKKNISDLKKLCKQ